MAPLREGAFKPKLKVQSLFKLNTFDLSLVSHLFQGVQNQFSKQEMELSKQEMESFLPLPGLWSKNFFSCEASLTFQNLTDSLTHGFTISFSIDIWSPIFNIFTCFHLLAPIFTYFYLFSPIFTYFLLFSTIWKLRSLWMIMLVLIIP